jgi:hypothetical protein
VKVPTVATPSPHRLLLNTSGDDVRADVSLSADEHNDRGTSGVQITPRNALTGDQIDFLVVTAHRTSVAPFPALHLVASVQRERNVCVCTNEIGGAHGVQLSHSNLLIRRPDGFWQAQDVAQDMYSVLLC